MRFRIIQKSIALVLFLASAVLIFSCQSQNATNAPTGDLSQAYKKLFDAVKSKDTEKIKAIMSKNSMGLAEFAGAQQKKPVEEVLKNGFTATTFSETLPKMRDERIKDGFGAIEVWNEKEKRWEDLPFIMEDGSWKFAIGDMFKGTFQSPGQGQAIKEQEEANKVSNNVIQQAPPNVNGKNNANTANVNTIQVEPIKPKPEKKK